MLKGLLSSDQTTAKITLETRNNGHQAAMRGMELDKTARAEVCTPRYLELRAQLRSIEIL